MNELAAGRRTRNLFQGRAVNTLANDYLIWNGLCLLTASIFIVFYLVNFFMSPQTNTAMDQTKNLHAGKGFSPFEISDTVEFWSVMGPQVFGLVTCLLLTSTALEIVISGYKAVFVCFVQVRNCIGEVVVQSFFFFWSTEENACRSVGPSDVNIFILFLFFTFYYALSFYFSNIFDLAHFFWWVPALSAPAQPRTWC